MFSMAAPNCCWPDLPVDLLCSIQKHLPLADYVRFGAVCRSWYCAAKLRRHRPAAGPPWLMLLKPIKGVDDSVVYFVSPDGETYSFPVPVQDFYSRPIRGSSNGWLISRDRTAKVLNLLNPLTGAQFQLPRINGADVPPDRFSRGGVGYATRGYRLLFDETVPVPAGGSTTLDCGCTVAAILAGANDPRNACIVVTRKGSEGWTVLNPGGRPHQGLPYSDIIFYKGFLCAVTDAALLVTWGASGPAIEHEGSTLTLRGLASGEQDQLYLVESAGDLLLVVVRDRYKHPWAPAMWTYAIYKLDLGVRGQGPEQVCSLGERALFLGLFGESMSLSVRGFPCLMENCIYLSGGHAKPLDPEVTLHRRAFQCHSLALWFTPHVL